MFCASCGQQIVETNARFCPSCGKAIVPLTPPGASSPAAYAAPVPASPVPVSAMPPVSPYGGFWKRTAAYIVDSILVTVLMMATIFGAYLLSGGDAESVGFAVASQASVWLIGWLYWAGMESSKAQATFGKQALGIKVTDLQGNRIGFGRATGRYFGKIISSLLLGIGFLMCGWTARKQALHDMMASTLVVNKDADALSLGTAPATRTSGALVAAIVAGTAFVAIAMIGILAAIAIPQYQDYVTRARSMELYTHGMRAAELVGTFYERESDVPSTLESLGYQVPPGFSISVNPNNGIVTAVHNTGRLTLRFVPSLQDGKVQWRCDPGEMRGHQVPAPCRPPK